MWQRLFALTILVYSCNVGAVTGCGDWFAMLDNAILEANLVDLGSQRVESFPHLRVNRWLVFLQTEARTEEQQSLWLQLASREARQGWLSELVRLDPTTTRLAGDAWRTQLDDCLTSMTELTGFPGVPKVPIAPTYSNRNRLLGLYPLVRIVAAPAINSERDAMKEKFRRPVRLPIRHYQVAPFPGNPPPPSELSRNALEMPLPSEGARNALLNFYAPVISVANALTYNQPGTVRVAAGTPWVDHRRATAYSWLSWTRYKGHNLLQLNYQFWFSKRPASGSIELSDGQLDNLIWRVTLKPDGNVLMYDSIHGNGFHHKVFPVARGLVAAQDGPADPVYYPGLAPNAAQQRVSLILEPDSHYIVRVEKFIPGQQLEQFQLENADVLRQLVSDQGTRVSIYDHNGLVPTTQGREHLLLWPFGIPSPGSLRQPGNQPISLIDKRYFDDARLLDVLFDESTWQ